jgi:hypothetical protein
MFNRQTRFLLIWIVTNTLAWAVSFLVAYLLGIILYDYLATTIPSDEPKVSYSFFVSHSHSGLFAFLSFALAGGVIGTMMGTTQWLMLRLWYGVGSRWIAGSSIGWTGGILLAISGIYFGDFMRITEPGAMVVMILIGGATSTITGWWILRQHSLKKQWWIVANTFGWAIGAAVAYRFIPLGDFFVIYLGAITGMVGAVLTGLALTRLAVSTSNNG